MHRRVPLDQHSTGRYEWAVRSVEPCREGVSPERACATCIVLGQQHPHVVSQDEPQQLKKLFFYVGISSENQCLTPRHYCVPDSEINQGFICEKTWCLASDQPAALSEALLNLPKKLLLLGFIRITPILLAKDSAGYFQAVPAYFQQAHIIVKNTLSRFAILRFVYDLHALFFVLKSFQDSMAGTYLQPWKKFFDNPGCEYHSARGGKQDLPEIDVSVVGEDSVVTENVNLFLCAQCLNVF